MTEREQHDYPAMLADLQAHPNEERIVWRRPLTDKTARQAAAVAGSLRSWIDYPHRDERGHIACHRDGCDPFHKGEGGASSKSDQAAGEAQVVGKWVVAGSPPDDLATWLPEQIAEDESGVRLRGRPLGEELMPGLSLRRVLAECDAKRRIIAEHAEDAGYCRRCEWDSDEREDPALGDGTRWVKYPCPTLRVVGLPYADRPGYREEWKP